MTKVLDTKPDKWLLHDKDNDFMIVEKASAKVYEPFDMKQAVNKSFNDRYNIWIILYNNIKDIPKKVKKLAPYWRYSIVYPIKRVLGK